MSEHSDASSEGEEVEFQPEEMPMDICVNLDRDAYFVGQDICGTVEIDNQHRRKMRGVRLTLRCRGEVFWLDLKKNHKNINDCNFLHIEKYIEGDGHLTYLEVGRHSFPFTVSLTSKRDLPSAMEFPYGNVRYLLAVDVDWPWASLQGHEKLVNVLNLCDLRKHREALQPASFTETMKLGFLSPPINISGRLEKIAYVPGEEILVDVEIENKSSARVSEWRLRLTEIVDYYSSEGKHKESRCILAEIVYEPIPGKSDCILGGEPLMIPAIPQSGRLACEFMKLNYEVSIYVRSGNNVKSAKTGIFIGTLPTKNSYKRFEKHIPPKSCTWPAEDITDLPYGEMMPTLDRNDLEFRPHMSEVDPEYKLQYVAYLFNRERAKLLIEENEESSDEEVMADDDLDAMSAFSL